MSRYFLDQDHFVIEDYHLARPFASFLPGVAGLMGIPIWAFYVNRAQGIAGFGVRDKDSPIMEYHPANKAYRLVSSTGFRTFVKIARGEAVGYYEPFLPPGRDSGRQQTMVIRPAELEFEERSEGDGLRVNVHYFTLPGEDFGGLVRCLTIENISSDIAALEVLDGLPAVIPYGSSYVGVAMMSNTLQAWMGVFNLEQGVPFYKLRASAQDTTQVEDIEAGHFYLAFTQDQGKTQILPAIVDPEVVFGFDTSLSLPDEFLERPLEELLRAKQVMANRVPCGFFGVARKLEPGEQVSVFSIVGHASAVESINRHSARISRQDYLDEKRRESARLIEDVTACITTQTSSAAFDAYCKQTFLDNVLRGGYPISLESEDGPFVYYVYSRKHGDLERDYNFFSLLPEFYSQGNGNYRDVNQNRRNDVRIFPWIDDFDVVTFLNLIQPDGYNPLVLVAQSFVLHGRKASDVLKLVERDQDRARLKRLLEKPFRPGQLVKVIQDRELQIKVPVDAFVRRVLKHSEQVVEAEFGEGYWVDHWVYNLDLIEGFLSVYPDRKRALLFDRSDYTYYDSPACVLPRADKVVLVDGKVKQFGAVVVDEAKKALIRSRSQHPNLVRVDHGQGAVYRTNLFSKLLCLALNKFATLDPFGMGIEMEADKPGWCDAMNGLPGLFGSSMCETYELRRLLACMLDALEDGDGFACRLPVEVYDFLRGVERCVDDFYAASTRNRDHVYWDRVAREREVYREKVKLGFDRQEETLRPEEVGRVLTKFLKKVDEGIARAVEMSGGTYPTYFYYDVEAYEEVRDADGVPQLSRDGYPVVRVKRFKPIGMPLFLEGFVKAMKAREADQAEARQIYQRVRASGLYDQKLKMYRANESIEDQPSDIGRARAFNRGWLENESIWLHMEYKYMLELLKAGLYDEFFQDFRNALIPFQDPVVYGRSPLENSSFIVSSSHLHEGIHGAGFVARLSGATAEFLSMWWLMMTGHCPFDIRDDQLCLELKPILPGWLFDEEGRVSFRFLASCVVTYHNPQRKDTFAGSGLAVERIALRLEGGDTVDVVGGVVEEPYVSLVRSGKVASIDLFFAEV